MNDYDRLRDKLIELMDQYGNVYERVKKEDDYKNSFRDIISHELFRGLQYSIRELQQPRKKVCI